MTVATNGAGAVSSSPPPDRLREIQEGLALKGGIRERLAELRQAERQAEMQIITIRTVIAEFEAQQEKAERAGRVPPTP